jgi:hypothetical protein
MNPDLLNSMFEWIGGLMVFNHCRVLYRDKAVQGISLLSNLFFTGWGVWNIIYYPMLNQMWSFYGSVFLTVANMSWLGGLLWYRRKPKYNINKD